MRSRALTYLTRLTCAVSISTIMIIGHVGCDGGASEKTGTVGQLPPEATKANNAMENFVKDQEKKK
jgi:hypothetical protein